MTYAFSFRDAKLVKNFRIFVTGLNIRKCMKKIMEMMKAVSMPCMVAMLILALLQPFGINHLDASQRIPYILMTSVVCVLITMFSKWVVAACMKRHCETLRDHYLRLTYVFLVNIPLLTIGFASMTCWWLDMPFSWELMTGFLVGVVIISFFVFLGTALQLKSNLLKQELENVKAINALLEERQAALEQQQEDAQAHEAGGEEVCRLGGQSSHATLEVNPKDIVYIESMANYANICYMQQGEICHQMLRLTLKSVKESLSNAGYMVQCHRAFLVNLNFVVQLLHQDTGYSLQLFGVDQQIPVSRSNVEGMKGKLQRK